MLPMRISLVSLLFAGAAVLFGCGKNETVTSAQSQMTPAASVFIVEEYATTGSLIRLSADEIDGVYAEDADTMGNARFVRVGEIIDIAGSSVDEVESLKAVAREHGLYVRSSDLKFISNGKRGSLVLGEIPLFRIENLEGVDPREVEEQDPVPVLGEARSNGAHLLSPWDYQKQWVAAGVPAKALEQAITYFERNASVITNKRFIVIADFTAKSNTRRLFFLNTSSGRVERYYVAHGAGANKQAGPLLTHLFSNTPNSMLTPKGFHLTSVTYTPSPSKLKSWGGIALRLRGLQPGKNDNTLQRGVVFHGTAYATDAWVKQAGYTGRSLGCPATDRNHAQRLIQDIKGGALFYHYVGE